MKTIEQISRMIIKSAQHGYQGKIDIFHKSVYTLKEMVISTVSLVEGYY